MSQKKKKSPPQTKRPNARTGTSPLAKLMQRGGHAALNAGGAGLPDSKTLGQQMIAIQNAAGQTIECTFDAAYDDALALYHAEKYEQALIYLEQLAARAGQLSSVYVLLGSTYYLLDRTQESLACYQKAVHLDPNGGNYVNLALAYAKMGNRPLAIESYEKSLALDPQQAQAWNNLGNLYTSDNSPEGKQKSIHCYENAVRYRPNYTNAMTNLAFAHEGNKQYDQALRIFREVLAIDPDFFPAITNLAELLEKMQKPQEALALYTQKAKQFPDQLKMFMGALTSKYAYCDWQFDEVINPARMNDYIQRPVFDYMGLVTILGIEGLNAAQQRMAAQKAGEHFCHYELAAPPMQTKRANTSPKIKLGYLSTDFRNHPVTHLVGEVLMAHDLERFDVTLYAYGKDDDDDEYRRRLKSGVQQFKAVGHLSDQNIAAVIMADEIDILVDLTGYTTGSRVNIMALRPAPIQVSWLGFVGTLGVARLADYILGDQIVTPAEHQNHFSETIVQLPYCFQPNPETRMVHPMTDEQIKAGRIKNGLPADAFVLCSFNQGFKFQPQMWRTWCQMMQQIPDSVLWLPEGKFQLMRDHLHLEAAKMGIAAERIIFAPWANLETHQQRIQLADLALDTFPYNSGTTASDALRSGVPLLTKKGDLFVSRMAASLLHAVHLDEMITESDDAYLTKAVALANQPKELKRIKAALRTTFQDHDPLSPHRFVKDLERAYQMMVERFEQTPQLKVPLVVPPLPFLERSE